MTENETEKSKSKSLDPEHLHHVLEVIQSLNGTLINIKRYPSGSAVVKMAMKRGVDSLNWILQKVDNFTLSEHERSMMVDDIMLDTKIQQKAYVESFVKQLHSRDIRSVTFLKGLADDELISFLDVLSQKPDDIREIDDLSGYIEEKGIKNIELDKKVYVAIGKDESVARTADLEMLGGEHGKALTRDELKDGKFLSFLLSKIPLREFNLNDSDMEKIKDSINYDKLKEAKNIDFDRIGPLFTAAMERVLQLDDLEDTDGIPMDSASKGWSKDQRIEARRSNREKEERINKLVDTFRAISKTIVSFDNPKVRAKLLIDFIRVVTNFKSLTLARVLTSKIEMPEGFDIKATVMSSLSLKKKSKIVDIILTRLSRVVEGLVPEDFRISPEELEESDAILIRALKQLRNKEDPTGLGEKAQRALGIARLVKKEAKDQESLLILKVRRLIVKPPEYFLKDEFLDYFSDLIERLEGMNRPDIVKKLLEKLSENLNSDDKEIRIETVNSLIMLQKELFIAKQIGTIGEIYNILIRRLSKEKETRLFAMLLASIVTGFDKLIENDKFNVASNIIKSFDRILHSMPDEERKKIMLDGLSSIYNNPDLVSMLIEKVMSEDDSISDASTKVLLALPSNAAVQKLMKLLKESDQMRERKKCVTIISKFDDRVVDLILLEFEQQQPWYYIRNLLNLLAMFPREDLVAAIEKYLKHEDERVRKACLATLIKIGSANAQRAMITSLNDSERNIIKTVIGYFGQSRSKVATQALIDIIANKSLAETDPGLVCECTHALGRIGHPEAFNVLLGLIKKGGVKGMFAKRNDEILIAVLKAFTQIKNPKSAAIAKKYIKDKNTEVARAAKILLQAMD